MKTIMKKTKFPILGGEIKIYQKRINCKFEIWTVATIKKIPTIINHFCTRINVERILAYNSPGDISWEYACETEIPKEKTPIALKQETYLRKTWETEHIRDMFSEIVYLPVDRKTGQELRKTIIGKWRDDSCAFSFMPDGRMQWLILPPKGHHFHGLGVIISVNTWFVQKRMLWMMSAEKNGGSECIY
jgi:hypothetical protein